jgi:hypothetical protein
MMTSKSDHNYIKKGKSEMRHIKLIVQSEFHKTEITVLAKQEMKKVYATLSPSQVKKIRSKLCGISDCNCNSLGNLTSQFYCVPEQDGGLKLFDSEARG